MRYDTPTIQIVWLHSKYSNLKKGKIYVASAKFFSGKGENRVYTGYRITDEDGDYYTLDKKRLGRDFDVV